MEYDKCQVVSKMSYFWYWYIGTNSSKQLKLKGKIMYSITTFNDLFDDMFNEPIFEG